MNKLGKVFLVGAGPGDKELITIKGVEILKKAEVVIFDRLVSEEILNYAPKECIKINVGKESGFHPIKQGEINKIILEYALKGRLTVRLKGGDPFVFGRGAEEIELLKENNIPFEVVPGITSSISALAYAGIPVTHRDYSSSIHIVTAHAKNNGEPDINFEELAKMNGILIFLMGVSSVSFIQKGLLSSGMAQDTPCAVIENGTRVNQRKLITYLSNLSEDMKKSNIKPPSIIAVGKVCGLSDKFNWFLGN